MRKIYLVLASLLISTISYSIGVIVLEGNYQGKNLYVQNPFTSSGVGFCVQEVRVNGNVTTDEITSSAFEIDFKALKLKIGDKVEIKITHKDGCRPKVINPEVLKPKSTFDIVDMSVENMIFKWSTKNETGKLTYIVEQYRWNKWVKIGEVEGVGTSELNNYSFKVVPHSGKNKYRVKQIDYSGEPRISSKSAEYNSTMGEITFTPSKVTKEINFFSGNVPTETMFEIYDQFGAIVKRGFASKIDASNLPIGSYYINYDNKTSEFTKK